jgi:hypothetical protein
VTMYSADCAAIMLGGLKGPRTYEGPGMPFHATGLPGMRVLDHWLRAGLYRVRGATLDDTSWLRPTRHIWGKRRQPWVVILEGDEVFEGQSP